MTVGLTITSLGQKLPPYIILKSKNKFKIHQNRFPNSCIIRQNTNAWITENFMIDYLTRIIINLNFNPEDT